MSDYNYASFPLDMEVEVFRAFAGLAHLRPGESAPDGVVVDAATGEEQRLQHYWRKTPLVIEFGSIT